MDMQEGGEGCGDAEHSEVLKARRQHGVRAVEATSEKEDAACARGRARAPRTMITRLGGTAGQGQVNKEARERAMCGCVYLQRCNARTSVR